MFDPTILREHCQTRRDGANEELFEPTVLG
jgi:hypothetical protein